MKQKDDGTMEKCSFGCDLQEQLDRHHVKEHCLGERQMSSCCGKEQGGQAQYKKHMKICQKEGRSYAFSICNKVFKNQGYRDRHENTHKGGDPALVCKTRERQFVSKQGLFWHMEHYNHK